MQWRPSWSSIMCTIKRTSSDISDKSAFAPPGHIKRQQCKSKEALFCNIFDFFIIVCTLDFQAGNFTCILRMKSFEDISCKRLLLQGKDLKNARRRLWKKLERFNRAKKSLFENRLYCQCRFYFQGQRSILSISSTSNLAKLHI